MQLDRESAGASSKGLHYRFGWSHWRCAFDGIRKISGNKLRQPQSGFPTLKPRRVLCSSGPVIPESFETMSSDAVLAPMSTSLDEA